MSCHRTLAALAFIALAASLANAQPPRESIDRGPALAAALEVAPGKLKDTTRLADTTNYVFRGRVITLSSTLSLCFDTEHMRVAGAWFGKPVVYRPERNMGPTIEGSFLFTTRPGPGWSKAGDWRDPRYPAEGPLPRDWAHYKGLQLFGDKVVLSYSVGDCAVLEMPAAEGDAVTRTFNVSESAAPLGVLILEVPNGRPVVNILAGKAEDANRALVEVATAEGRLVVGVVGAPEGAAWETIGGRVHLKLPALPSGVRFRVAIARLSKEQTTAAFMSQLAEAPADFRHLKRRSHWPTSIETTGHPSADLKSPYVLDTIEPPSANPWGASIRFSGFDFFPDGRAAVCTWDGDVWIVSGLDAKLDKVRWRRFAAGLQQPLGLKIVKGEIYTAGRDQITRLVDLDGDGEADFYENFNNDAGLTLQRHEFVMDLQTDQHGNFYYCRSGHYIASKKGENCCVFKLSPEGKTLEVFARGFREPNGLNVDAQGMTVADNEGNGVPQTPLYHLKPGGKYGFRPPSEKDKGGWTLTERPIVWLPHDVDRSAGGQVWAPKGWGPMGGQLLHTSYGSCGLFGVLIDRRAEPWQGAAWKFPLTFHSGVMRGRFHPVDGQLYLCGLRGWDTNAVRDGQFCRVRATGVRAPLPVEVSANKSSLSVLFSDALDRESAVDEQNWSGDWVPAGKAKIGTKEELAIDAIHLDDGQRRVRLEIGNLAGDRNYTLHYRLKAKDGPHVKGTLHGTIHRAN